MRASSAARQSVAWAPLTAVLVALLPALAAAQEPVKSFDQLDTRLKPGDAVYVTDARGQEVKGKILELTPSALTLKNEGGRTFQARDVSRITQKQGHKTGKGALWGLVAGGCLSVWPAVYAATCDSEDCQYAALTIPIFVGAGVGIGALVGALTPGRELVVYRAPGASTSARFSIAPMITPRAKGVAVAFAF